MTNMISEQELFEKWKQECFSNYYTDVGYHRSDLFLSTLTGGEMYDPKHQIHEALAILQKQVRKGDSSNYGFFQVNTPSPTPFYSFQKRNGG